MKKPILAVDFGTSHTYLYRCPADDLLPLPLELWNNHPGIETAVLYRPKAPLLVGPVALAEWGQMTTLEREGAQLRIRFKPELTDGDGQRWATDFLSGLLAEAELRRVALDPLGCDIYFGMPCDSHELWRSALKGAATAAGFGEVKLLEEPLAVLVSALAQGDVAPSEAMKHLAVLDFGGGTCDVTMVERLRVLQSCSDWHLGGRVFDDLFYQILLDRNASLEKSLKSDGTEAFVRAYWCPLLKEQFSAAMARDASRRWSGSAGIYGVITDLSWQEFLSRCASYRATKAMVAEVPHCVGALQEEHLLHRLDALLARLDGEPSLVLLSGGSSLWPFVAHQVAQRFPAARVLCSDQPGGAVARGLALLPALMERNEKARSALQRERRTFVLSLQNRSLNPLRQNYGDMLADELAEKLLRQVFQPALQSFARNGGAVKNFEIQMKQKLDDSLVGLKDQARTMLERWCEDTAAVIGSETEEWFRRHGIRNWGRQVTLQSLWDEGLLSRIGQTLSQIFMGHLMGQLSLAGSVIVALVAAAVFGGSGMALVAAGPAGFAIGGALALGGCLLGRSSLERGLASVPLPSLVTKRILTESRCARELESVRLRLHKAVESTLKRLWLEQEEGFAAWLDETVKAEIDGLDGINSLKDRFNEQER